MLESWCYGRKGTQTPGPGSYSIPSKVGEGPKYTFKERPRDKLGDFEPMMQILPSTLANRRTTFGGRTKVRAPDITPGPDINIRTIPGNNSPKFTIGARIETNQWISDNNPSGADYDIRREIGGRKSSIHTGPRLNLVDKRALPNPGSYHLPSDFEQHKPITIGSVLPQKVANFDTPPPGAYDVYDLNALKSQGIVIGEKRKERKLDCSPGPCDFQELKPLYNTTKIPYTLDKARPPLPTGDKHDQPYVNLGPTIVPKKVSMGIRPPTKYDTISPGPVYSSTSSLENRHITIGARIPLREKGSDTPSPCEYFKTPLEKPAIFGCFSGPQIREPEEIRRDRWKVPPGAYEIERCFDSKKETGKKNFGSRKWETYEADTDGPYYELQSTLSGPKFTIGVKVE